MAIRYLRRAGRVGFVNKHPHLEEIRSSLLGHNNIFKFKDDGVFWSVARRTALTASRSCIADDVTSAKYSFTREPFIPPKVVADLIIDHQALLNS